MIVDHPQSTSCSFTATGIGPTHFSKAASTRNQVPKFRMGGQSRLHLRVLVVFHILGEIARECRRFDELHPESLYANGVLFEILRYWRTVGQMGNVPGFWGTIRHGHVDESLVVAL